MILTYSPVFAETTSSVQTSFSDVCLKRETTMSDDLVIDSLSPRDRVIPMERVMSRNSARNYI